MEYVMKCTTVGGCLGNVYVTGMAWLTFKNKCLSFAACILVAGRLAALAAPCRSVDQ